MLDYHYSFPAIQGIQATRKYFTIMCPLGILSKIFIFHDNKLLPEFRAQRTVNETRIPVITQYILDNPKDYVFSSITASLDGEYTFVSRDEISRDIGILKIDMGSRLLINDGQHRKLAIDQAIEAVPDLVHESISVVLFIDENLKRSQQMFSDLNMHAVNASRSISILYDARDPLAVFVREIKDTVKNMRRYVDCEHKSLSKNSNKLFLLSNIYNATKRMLGKHALNTAQIPIMQFWENYLNGIVEFQYVINKEISPKTLRKEYILSYGTVMEAIGDILNKNLNDPNFDIKKFVESLNKIDWSRTNMQWRNRVFNMSGRIVKNNMSIRMTKIQIQRELNMRIDKVDLDFENAYIGDQNE